MPGMSIKTLRATFGTQCHWCGLPMDFAATPGTPDAPSIEHLSDATLGQLRAAGKHRRLAHTACNQARNGFRMQAERDFLLWLAERRGAQGLAPAEATAVATAATVCGPDATCAAGPHPPA